MRTIYIEPGEGGIPHRVYDMSIENLEERKKKSIVFPTTIATANYLGILHNKISELRMPGK